jgi:hypothetical protein
MTTTWGLTAAYLCSAHALIGQAQEAAQCACRALPVLRSVELEGLLWIHVALLCVRTGRASEAARLAACSRAWYAANHNVPDGTIAQLHDIAEADIVAALGAVEAERLRSESAALDGNELVHAALHCV